MKNYAKLALLSLSVGLIGIPAHVVNEVGAEIIEEATTVIGLKNASGNLGFELSNSDYAGANYGNNFDALQRNTNYINAFDQVKFFSLEKNDFQKNNPGGGSTYSSFGTGLFPNMWAPQTWLEQDSQGVWHSTREFVTGDIVYIPKDTTFPSYAYASNPVGNVKKYKTTEEAAFIYNSSNQFVPCDFTLTTISELQYYENVDSKSYLGIKLKDSDYGSASSNKTLTTSKLDYFTFRKGIEIQGGGKIIKDTMIGAEHDYHYGVIINKDGDETLAIKASGFKTNDIIKFNQYITLPAYSYLNGSTTKPTGYVIEFDNLFKLEETGFIKTSSEPYEYEDDLPLVDAISGITVSYLHSTTIYTPEQAAANNVPEGYIGTVAPVSGNNGGFTIGFGTLEEKIHLSKVISMKFRFYMESTSGDNDSYPEIRITKDAGTSWIVRLPRTKFTQQCDNWVEIEMTPEGTPYCTANEFKKFADSEGFLGSFFFGYRGNDNRKFYLDSVKVKLTAPDKEAPVIYYDGLTEITTRVGREFILDAKAYDLFEAREIPLAYEWYDGDVKLDYIPSIEGIYTLRLTATDTSKNMSYIELIVRFLEPDTVAPVLSLKISTIHAAVGEKMYFNVSAIDDVDGELPVKINYPSNMFDEYMCLKAGTFTVTFVATDLSKNIATKTLTVIVK